MTSEAPSNASTHRVRRINGLQRPHNPMQISTWILFPATVTQFLLLLTPCFPGLFSKTVVTLSFLSFASLASYFGYLSCTIDPVDSSEPVPVPYLYSLLFPPPLSPPDPITKFCWVCQKRVNATSMHCKFCDKCVARFDHHCQWLNTCVGLSNYPHFFLTVLFTFSMLCVDVLAGAFLIGAFLIADRSPNAWLAAAGTMELFHAVCAVMVGQLLAFHVGLRREGLTTYEYIVRDNAARRDAERKRGERERRRNTEMEKGDRGRKFALRWGGCLTEVCAACGSEDAQWNCDPLVREELAKSPKKAPANAATAEKSDGFSWSASGDGGLAFDRKATRVPKGNASTSSSAFDGDFCENVSFTSALTGTSGQHQPLSPVKEIRKDYRNENGSIREAGETEDEHSDPSFVDLGESPIATLRAVDVRVDEVRRKATVEKIESLDVVPDNDGKTTHFEPNLD